MKKKIIIVDDDSGISEVMKIVLEGKGYSVLVASDYASFKELIKGDLPDLVILDVWLGQTSGKEIALTLRGDPRTSSLPIIIVTASDNSSTIASEVKATDFLAKPFNVIDLERIVDKYLA